MDSIGAVSAGLNTATVITALLAVSFLALAVGAGVEKVRHHGDQEVVAGLLLIAILGAVVFGAVAAYGTTTAGVPAATAPASQTAEVVHVSFIEVVAAR